MSSIMENIVEVEVEILNDQDNQDIEGIEENLSGKEKKSSQNEDEESVQSKKARHSFNFEDQSKQEVLLKKSPSPDGITVPFQGDKYFVEKVIDYADSGTNKDKYLVKWKGWDSKFNTWEPIESLQECCDCLMEFYYKRRAEWQEVLKNSTYVRMSDGKLRRQGAKLAVPVDPRSVPEIVKEFKNLQTTPLTLVEKTAAERIYLKSLRLKRKSIFWEEKKLKRYLEKGFDGDLDVNMNRELQTQLYYLRLVEKVKRAREELKIWESELNAITLGKPVIIVENEADFAKPPKDFIYSNSYVPGEGVVIPTDPPLGCLCSENSDCWSNRSRCCPSGFGAENGYTKRKKVKEGVGIPLYECNSACKCGPSCPNRVVQDGYSTLEGSVMKIFRTSNGCGWGVKSVKAIQKGVFVGLYIGEVITTEEADTRGKKYDDEGRTYLFDLDFNTTTNPFTVDAKNYGNFTHFINHSCDANLGVYSVWVNCLDPNLPMLALFSVRDIHAGEEITMNYSNDLDTKSRRNDSGRQRCLCETKKCRGFIF